MTTAIFYENWKVIVTTFISNIHKNKNLQNQILLSQINNKKDKNAFIIKKKKKTHETELLSNYPV